MKGQLIAVDAVMLAVGRMPNIQGLGLKAAGVAVDQHGAIKVDQYSSTSRAEFHPMKATLSGSTEKMMMKLVVDAASRQPQGAGRACARRRRR